ncbi:MAG: peptidoglycan-binding protein, partial [Okeania sp. SIO2H7]|nr:peptidoglycan-binding protein [Okeania sp. SIO2H7]
MRLTTITALASITATIAYSPEAIAQSISQFPTETDRREFHIPQRQSGAVSSSEMFSKPFYPNAAQRQYEEKIFSVGDRGSHVWILQRRLRARGFDPGPIDSVFGSQTKAALKAFQKSRGLDANGVADEVTWKALARSERSLSQRKPVSQRESVSKKQPVSQIIILDRGSRGSKVKTLQLRLEIQGYDPGPIDGVFGTKTAAAVKQFQEAQGLKTT